MGSVIGSGEYVRCAWRAAWIMWDLDNGHSCGGRDAGVGYMWVFPTRKEALNHRREQHAQKFGARLSMPARVTAKTRGRKK